ncbi:probable transcription factor At1g11510 [Pistacia vera]|uniref:probable transcription factor At1g11510 n=1 Tax=Pistacia vera TaxID=55513 RepID=UPI00126302C2|nr:probable transcription factor At1g11510 [Pistacia vera]
MEEPEEGVTAQHRRDRAAYDIWKKKNSTARITLLSSMDNDLMKKYRDYELAKDIKCNTEKAQGKKRKFFKNNLGKWKKGEDRSFSKLYERHAYDLSKKLWDNGGISGVLESVAKYNVEAKKNQNKEGSSESLALFKAELNDGARDREKIDIDNDKKGSLSSEKEMLWFDKSVGMARLEEPKERNWWKKLQIAQLQLFVERNDLIKEQTKLILEAMKSSGH